MSHRLLPRYRHDFDQQERGLAQRIVRNGKRVPTAPMIVKAGASELDRERLRGIPVVGGVTGTIRGTDPFWETAHRMDGLRSVI
jgi:hypothetical protein